MIVHSETIDPTCIEQFTIAKNQSIVLVGSDYAWELCSGTVDVLGTYIKYDKPWGLRRSLVQLQPGVIIPGSDVDPEFDNVALMLVANEECVIRRYESKSLASNAALRQSVMAWYLAVEDHLTLESRTPTRAVFLEEGVTTWGMDEILAQRHVPMGAFRVIKGKLKVVGFQHLRLTPETGCMLLGNKLWLEVAAEGTEVELMNELPANGVFSFESATFELKRLVLKHIQHLSQQGNRLEIERRKQSQQRDSQETTDAISDLAAILNPTSTKQAPSKLDSYESSLMFVMSIIGEEMGVIIKPPQKSDDLSRSLNMIEGVARASGIRYRQLTLGPQWWTFDAGPMVGYLENRPIALLPTAGGGYRYIDPKDPAVAKKVTLEIVEQLDSAAHMIYRPFETGDTDSPIGLVKFSLARRKFELGVILALPLIGALLGMLHPKLTGSLIDSAIPFADKNLVWQMAVLLIALKLVLVVLSFLGAITGVRFNTITNVSTQAAMWDRLLKLRPNFYRQFSSGDLQSRVNSVGDVITTLNSATVLPMISGFMASLNFFLLFYLDAKLAGVAVLSGVFMLAVTSFTTWRIRHLSKDLHAASGEFSGMAIQLIGGIAKIRTAGAEKRSFRHWVNRYARLTKLKNDIRRIGDNSQMLNVLIPGLATIAIYWIAITGAASDSSTGEFGKRAIIPMGVFIAFTASYNLFLTGWNSLTGTLISILDSLVLWERVKPLMQAEPEVPPDAADPGRLLGGIALENVDFRYVPDGPLILDKLSISIRPGEFVAIVGPSGSGKSTLLRLLLGFEEPASGRILYDGQDLSGLDILAVRRQIGTVLQNGRLQKGSVKDAIANNLNVSNAELWDAIADAGFAEDVEQMAMGIHTIVSEGGTNLSGGQRQRLLIARALVTRPKIVFFDEATSALDNKTQSIVSEAMNRRRVSRVVIAHRLSTIRNADRIVVLQAGKIVQSGSFDQLMEVPGVFRDLTARQTL